MKRFKKHSAKTNITHYGVLIRRQFRQIFSNRRTFFSLLLQAPVMLVISLFVYDKNTFAEGQVQVFSAAPSSSCWCWSARSWAYSIPTARS